MKMYGYMRISTKEQNEARQLSALIDYGIRREDIYMDKQSGKDFVRAEYLKLVRGKLRRGDVFAVKSIDRLGRNYTEIIDEWKYISKNLGADIVILDMPVLDTRRSCDLTGTFISDIVLQILSYVAQNERDAIRQRQSEGIAAAKSRGVRFGRPPLPIPDDFWPFYNDWKRGENNHYEAERILNISKVQFYRLIRRAEKYSAGYNHVNGI